MEIGNRQWHSPQALFIRGENWEIGNRGIGESGIGNWKSGRQLIINYKFPIPEYSNCLSDDVKFDPSPVPRELGESQRKRFLMSGGL